jgi:hypothetical protein
MKFLLDQDVYSCTLRFLDGLGRDVVPAARIGLSQASDEELQRMSSSAIGQQRLIIRSAAVSPPWMQSGMPTP